MEAITARVDTEPVLLVPIGDIQYVTGGQQCDLKRLQAAIEFGLSHPGGRFIGVGDYIDFASPSNRRHMRVVAASLYDTALDVIDRAALSLVDELVEILKPTKGRWLGLVHGHHYYDLRTGRISDEYLAEKLDAPFLGTSAMISLTTPKCSEPLRIFVHHYWAAGRTPGAHLHEAHRRMASHDAHVYLYGHCHRLGVEPLVRLTLAMADSGPRVVARNTAIVFCGSYSLHWAQGSTFAGRPWGTYAEHKGLPPTVTGSPYLFCYTEDDPEKGKHWKFRTIIDW